jgi:hypothetical protein
VKDHRLECDRSLHSSSSCNTDWENLKSRFQCRLLLTKTKIFIEFCPGLYVHSLITSRDTVQEKDSVKAVAREMKQASISPPTHPPPVSKCQNGRNGTLARRSPPQLGPARPHRHRAPPRHRRRPRALPNVDPATSRVPVADIAATPSCAANGVCGAGCSAERLERACAGDPPATLTGRTRG